MRTITHSWFYIANSDSPIMFSLAQLSIQNLFMQILLVFCLLDLNNFCFCATSFHILNCFWMCQAIKLNIENKDNWAS